MAEKEAPDHDSDVAPWDRARPSPRRKYFTAGGSLTSLPFIYFMYARGLLEDDHRLWPVGALYLGTAGYYGARITLAALAAGAPSLLLFLVGRLPQFDRPSWWGRLIWLSFLGGFLGLVLFGYQDTVDSISHIEIEVVDIRWDSESDEVVVKAYLDRAVARGLEEGFLRGELSVQGYRIDTDYLATEHTTGSHLFPREHYSRLTPLPQPDPGRSALTDALRVKVGAKAAGYESFVPRRVALRFVTRGGEPMGELREIHNPSGRGGLYKDRQGIMRFRPPR